MSDLSLSLPAALRPPRLLALPGMAFCFLLAFVLLHEWWTIGIEADPAVIAEYHFGSDAMMGEGGWNYASAALYARSSLYMGVGFAVAGIGFVVAAVRSTGRATALAYVFFVLSIMAMGLLAR